MLKNVGSADRIIRILTAVVVFVLILTAQVTGTLAVVLGILAAVFLVTGFIGTCPIYYALKLSTNRKVKKA
jgi:hypothetical protein